MGNKTMIGKKIILLSFIVLLGACNAQNTKTDEVVTTKPEPSLKDLITLRQNAEKTYEDGDWKNAIILYQQLAQNVTKDAEPWFRIGNSYARLKQPVPALQAYQKALSLDSSNSKIWHNMGIVQLKLATNTFVEMQRHTAPHDPLHKRAGDVVDAISDLLQQNFGVETKE